MLVFNRHHTINYLCIAIIIVLACLQPAEAKHRPHHKKTSAIATYFGRNDSNHRMANGDIYGKSGPWFCAVDISKRHLLNHHIHVVNKRNGRSHVFLVADLGRFGRNNLDVSRGGAARMSGHGRPENFPVEWHDLGRAAKSHQNTQNRKKHRHH